MEQNQKKKFIKWLLAGIFVIVIIIIAVFFAFKEAKKSTEFPLVPFGKVFHPTISPGEIPNYNELIEKYAERLKNRQTIQLGIGQNIFRQSYQIEKDVFECEFRAYRPSGIEARMKVAYAKDERAFLGYDPQLGAPQYGLAGQYSGLESNPEKISIDHPANQEYTAILELYDLVQWPVSVVLEVWETPARPPIMMVWPQEIKLTISPGEEKTISSDIIEAGSQLAVQKIKIELSDLKNEKGDKIEWNVSPSISLNDSKWVLAGETEYYETTIKTQKSSIGTYSGTITIFSANSGKRIQPVKIIVK